MSKVSSFGEGSNTPLALRNLWRTPPFLFQRLNQRWGFGLDAAASAENSLCSDFISAEEDSLVTPWDRGPGTVWCNPPYEFNEDFVIRARYESRRLMRGAVLLIPAAVGNEWFHDHVLGVASEVWLFKGRLAFISAETGKPESGSSFDSMLVYWDGERQRAPTYVGSITRQGRPASIDEDRWNSLT